MGDNPDMNDPDLLDISTDRTLAYHRTEAVGEKNAAPGVVFLGGFTSDMTGTKATWLEGWARARGRAFLRFDYRGHGASSGAFEDGTIGDWADDAAEAVTRLTEGPQILVGSSMGGWIALLLARRMPERVAGLVGIAAAPDFTEDLVRPSFTDAERARLEAEGQVVVRSDYEPETYPVTKRLLDEARDHLVLRAPLALPFPVRLLHGTADADVPQSVALRLLDHAECPDIRLELVKGADHRFSGPRELDILGRTLDELTDTLAG